MTDDRRPVVLGISLKLYMTPPRAHAWAAEVNALVSKHPAVQAGRVELFVLPALPALPGVQHAFDGTAVAVGAQDLFWADDGAFTGAVSGADLAAVGCRFVEIGHAERRRWFGESDATIAWKLTAAFRNDLQPVLCIGERSEQDGSSAAAACVRQLDSVLDAARLKPGARMVVAYEPEWAIGAQHAASPEHVLTVCSALRRALEQRAELGDVRLIYGGSAQPGLLPQLHSSVDGLFLGRFAHDPAALGLILDEVMALP